MSVNTFRLSYYVNQAGLDMPEKIQKRDGRFVTFDVNRIEAAVSRCFSNCELPVHSTPTDVAERVSRAMAARYGTHEIASVEAVQDMVELVLQSSSEFEAAKRYIVYRERHAQERKLRPIPDGIREAFEDASLYFPTQAQQFMFFDKYARYNYDLGRRETWIETVQRSVDFLRELSENKLDDAVYNRIHNAILDMRAMPSMRLLATAGDYARDNSLAIYNCSYLPVRDIESFCEALFISMSGCGVGFSVESFYVDQFPRVKRQRKNQTIETFVVPDTTEGWIEALRHGVTKWWNGEDTLFDYSQVRRAGLPLRRKGGRSSGPEPLRGMLDFIRAKILSRQGSFIRSIDGHDMECAVGDAAVQGGVRRTAMISLFDWDDMEMRTCKHGANLDANPIRWNANNSAVWPENITQGELIQQMLDMDKGQRGEPGIFSRENAVRTRPARRKKARFGTNPCGEIILPPYGLCNLSIAVARPEDSIESLMDKVEIATIIGTIQSLATNFPGMRPEWKANCEAERLLGVDITGQQDCPVIRDPDAMNLMRVLAVETNKEYAEILGINPSAAITCDKPGGNSSQLLNVANGLGARHAKFLMRNMRVAATSPVARTLVDAGVKLTPENGQTVENVTTWVVGFPMKSPDGAVLRSDQTAVDQLDYWLMAKEHWTEHNPSCTVSYSPDELLEVIGWVWEHRQAVGGLSFLPRDNAKYAQMPYAEISEAEYEERLAAFPKIDFSRLYRHEQEDMTTATQELSCFAGSCDV